MREKIPVRKRQVEGSNPSVGSPKTPHNTEHFPVIPPQRGGVCLIIV
jgi:hypothetical protein